ncbi:transposase, partial [mine drainage metagenome]
GRPPEIAERLVPGHWEGDLIKGAHNRPAVGTRVERTTWFTVLSKMDDASAESALSGFSHVLNRIEAQKRLSLTYDQGREMAAHQRLTEATGGRSTAPIRTAPGSVASMRTPTVGCASTFPRGATGAATLRESWTRLPGH